MYIGNSLNDSVLLWLHICLNLFKINNREEVYYNPEPIDCKAKWDLTREWNLTALPLNKQKAAEITKQRAEKEKTIQHRNAQRAAEKGVPEPVQN